MSEQLRLGGSVEHMTFTRVDGRPVLAVGRSQGVELRSAPDNEVIGVLAGAPNPTSLLRIPGLDGAPDRLAIGGADGHVRLFDPGSRELAAAQRVCEGGVTDLAVATLADGARVVVAAHEDGITLWDPRGSTPEPLPDSPGGSRTRPFRVCAYRALGSQWLACAYSDNSLAVWDLNAPERPLVARLPEVHDGAMWSLVAVDEPLSGYSVATGSADGTIKLWTADAEAGLHEERVLSESATVRRLRLVRDADVPLLVSASASGTVALWRLDGPAERPLRTLRQHQGEVWALACATTADGGVLIASGDQHGDVEISSHQTELISDTVARDLLVADRTVWAAVSGATANGPFVACAGVDQVIHVIDPDPDLPDGEFGPLAVITETQRLHAHTSTVRSLTMAGTAFAPHLISGGADQRVLDWDPRTGELRRELPMKHRGEVWALAAFNLNGALHVASGSADGSVQMCSLLDDDGSAGELVTDIGAVNAVVATPYERGALLTIASTRGVRVVAAQKPEAVVAVSRHKVSAACAMIIDTQYLVVTARQTGDVSVVELVDPENRTSSAAFRHTQSSAEITALTTAQVGKDLLIFGGLDDGQLIVWQLDGTRVGKPIQTGHGAIRALGMVDVAAPGDTGGGSIRPALFAAADDGRVRLWPITARDLLRSGGTIGTGVRPATLLLQDQPTHDDQLGRNVLVDTIREVLMAEQTKPPVVVGVHGPWGHGKSSVLRGLRRQIDPVGADAGEGKPVQPTHGLVPRALETGEPMLKPKRTLKWKRKKQQGVRTNLNRAWAWSRLAKPRRHHQLEYVMRPLSDAKSPRQDVITVWFSPWMYESPQQVWAGLTREILNSIARRLSEPEQDRLWFDLNLRRHGSAAMRRQILRSFVPRTLPGMLIGLFTVVLMLAIAVTVGVAAWQTGGVQALIGSTVLLGGTALAVIVNVALKSYQKYRDWTEPDGPTRPPSEGVAGDGDWTGARDPLHSSERGYLYLLQHDVREVVSLAVDSSPVVIMVDDLDRCRPAIVADTVEAVNLFLNKAFGDCRFVIALDPATVAAQLETVYESLHRRAHDDPATFGHLQNTGWRFMEKIVDLPIRLPRLQDNQMSTYVEALLQPAKAPARQRSAPTPRTVSEPVDQGQQPSQSTALPEQPVPAAEPVDMVTAIRHVDELEQLPEVRRALSDAVTRLPQRNPRQTKAFLNLWRFYMVLDDRSNQLSTSSSAVERYSIEMARFVEMMVRWPWLLDMLGTWRSEESLAAPNTLADLIERSADDAAWTHAVTEAGLDATDPTIVGLRKLFHQKDMDREVFARIAVRYL